MKKKKLILILTLAAAIVTGLNCAPVRDKKDGKNGSGSNDGAQVNCSGANAICDLTLAENPVRIMWKSPSGSVSGYRIERCSTECTGNPGQVWFAAIDCSSDTSCSGLNVDVSINIIDGFKNIEVKHQLYNNLNVGEKFQVRALSNGQLGPPATVSK